MPAGTWAVAAGLVSSTTAAVPSAPARARQKQRRETVAESGLERQRFMVCIQRLWKERRLILAGCPGMGRTGLNHRRERGRRNINTMKKARNA